MARPPRSPAALPPAPHCKTAVPCQGAVRAPVPNAPVSGSSPRAPRARDARGSKAFSCIALSCESNLWGPSPEAEGRKRFPPRPRHRLRAGHPAKDRDAELRLLGGSAEVVSAASRGRRAPHGVNEPVQGREAAHRLADGTGGNRDTRETLRNSHRNGVAGARVTCRGASGHTRKHFRCHIKNRT